MKVQQQLMANYQDSKEGFFYVMGTGVMSESQYLSE